MGVSPQQICIWEVSIGIPGWFGMQERLKGHHDYGILLGYLQVKRGKTGISTACSLGLRAVIDTITRIDATLKNRAHCTAA